MKRKLLTLTVLLTGLFLYNSCTTYPDDYLRDYEVRKMIEDAIRENNKDLEFTQWEIIQVQVKASDWEWVYIDGHPDKGHWRAVADLPELTEFIFEKGAALGYVFLGEPGVDEVQKPLPYVQSHYDGDDEFGNPVFFTETISCDFQYGNPSTVAFYIEANDLFEDSAAPNNYYFRVVLIW